ncbi:MAG: hypothetical protein KDK28_11765 [Maritimibacter sp.]|nr:hypothetical protein [Maritimibacter sp.]
MTDAKVKPVTIHLFGAFSVTGPDGADLTPRSAKGQALLALLVTAPHHKRTRSWLQDKLWSRNDPASGSVNLRQVLTTLRRALAPWTELLQADRRAVWLDPALFTSDWEARATRDPAAFLEGIDVDDPEFDAWLTTQRMAPRDGEIETTAHRVLPAPPHLGPRRWRVALTGSDPTDGLAGYLESQLITRLSQSLLETGVAEIASAGNDARDPQAIDVTLALTPIGDGRYGARVSVLRPERRRYLWSATETVSITPDTLDDTAPLMALLANTQVAILLEIARTTDLPPGLDAGAQVLARSSHRVFSFDADTLSRTDTSLVELQDGRERGVVLGMRAQISVIRDIERLTAAPEETVEQGLYLAAKAIEADPFNSQVLAAAANAQVFLKWDIDSGAELAALALRTNRANPLAWWAQANVALYTQSFDRALDNAMTATQLAWSTPLQFWCQFQLGLAALAAGQMDLARRSLETSAAIAPSFRPPRRYLLALYAHQGQRDRAGRMAKDLAALEETFTLDAFARDDAYPISLARRVGLIDPRVLVGLDGP